ncbi:terminase small subunit [Limnoglobus roseus]|uniref:Terminase small subunit n=1 Tax=Limnoglobus roseus TaxID=2598579 RepID=A0A5C1AQN5_9BACT|nr:terminase small subunit [Limnoglobus roseus]QEL19168.1 hypothetical protein PX52LOC_06226 [Limnoglobus roseus]
MNTLSSPPVVEALHRVPPTGLTIQQREFVRLYLLKGSAYGAYLKAFSLTEPRDVANARAYAYRLLKTVEVKQLIRDSSEAVRKRLKINPHVLLQEATAVARSSAGDYFDFDRDGDPVPKPAREIDTVAQKAIKSITRTDRTIVHRHPDGTVTEERRVSTQFQLHDKMRAIQLLFRHMGLDEKVNPLEALISILPLELQHRVAEVLRTSYRRKSKVDVPPPPAID